MGQTRQRNVAEQVIGQQIEGASDLVNLHEDVRLLLRDARKYAVIDAALVVVMLAADACRYGSPPITLRIHRNSDGLRIEVDDHRPDTAAPNPEDYRICLLDRLTRARGMERHDGVTTTWVEMDLVADSAVA